MEKENFYLSPSTEAEQALVLDDSQWQRLLSKTGGAAAVCYQCGSCSAVCPWGLVNDQIQTARIVIRKAQLGVETAGEGLWLCTDCGQCEAICPRDVPVAEVTRALRQIAWEDRLVPEGLSPVLWSLYWNNNPWSQPPSERSTWASDLELPEFDSDQHDILLYIGCTASYDPRLANIARALVLLLRSAGAAFGVLGDEEPCCGDAALSLGHKDYFYDLAEKATTLFNGRGVKRLVALSPHCYNVFINHYPRSFRQVLEVHHYTQFVSWLMDNGKISFKGSVPVAATYHDPCLLARTNPNSDSSRRILKAIPGLKLVEMERSGQSTLCCGGGGGRMWQETEAGQRFSDLRIEEAHSTGAELLVTACPYCLTCLEDSVKFNKTISLEVLDLAELCLKALA